MFDRIRFLLLQVRNADDPMRDQEVGCFARAFHCAAKQIDVADLLRGVPSREALGNYDVVLLGGSGDYSVAEGGEWLDTALDTMRELYRLSKPTFASCWGFQAMAKALGGEVVTDMSRAELGTLPIQLTEAGAADPIFGPLPSQFLAPMGHQDIVDRLPDDAVLLASTDRVLNQAFRFAGKPIYCTQFHPELDRDSLIERVIAYPQYVERIARVPMDQFCAECRETPEVNTVLRRFVQHLFDDAKLTP